MSILPDRISERKWCLERGRLTTKLLTLSNPSRHSNFEGSRCFQSKIILHACQVYLISVKLRFIGFEFRVISRMIHNRTYEEYNN